MRATIIDNFTSRKVKFPLKLKLLIVMTLLIAASLVFFVTIALQIFTEDKSAYIFESILNKAETNQILLEARLKNELGSVGPDSTSSTSVVRLQMTEADSKKSFQLQPEKPLSNKYFSDFSSEDGAFKQKLIVQSQGKFFSLMNDEISPLNEQESSLLNNQVKDEIFSGVKEVNINGTTWLYGFHFSEKFHFYQVVMISKSEAYKVTDYLIKKSLFYGMFILGFAIIISVWISKPLTSQLEILFQSTQKIAEGNFSISIDIPAKDEVGALSDSVNYMSKKITQYMEEMKEKARLENEVAVAQLVQSSFFPRNEISSGQVKIAGFYEPATECGGDWWGVVEDKDQLIYLIADATGHGVPAALLTATINCCKSNLKYLLQFYPEIVNHPDKILEFINGAVAEAGKDIMLTCFVGSFNKTTNYLTYSNASHNPPLIFNASNPNLTKEDFTPLNLSVGPRLGQDLQAKYEKTTISLKAKDTIILYTDGITDAENTENKRFGERRLVKNVLMHHTLSPIEMRENFLLEFKNFINSADKKDDMTIVFVQV